MIKNIRKNSQKFESKQLFCKYVLKFKYFISLITQAVNHSYMQKLQKKDFILLINNHSHIFWKGHIFFKLILAAYGYKKQTFFAFFKIPHCMTILLKTADSVETHSLISFLLWVVNKYRNFLDLSFVEKLTKMFFFS